MYTHSLRCVSICMKGLANEISTCIFGYLVASYFLASHNYLPCVSDSVVFRLGTFQLFRILTSMASDGFGFHFVS